MNCAATKNGGNKYLRIDSSNIETEHICCAIGSDAENKFNANTKKEWMKTQFENGLVFHRLDERGKVFIEYMPAELCWKPVIAKNYFMINCLWVSGQFKGHGHSKRLLQYCIDDAKKNGKNGIVVVSSVKKKPFLTDKSFYMNHGFEVVDSAQPYFELLEYKINKPQATPQFSEAARNGVCSVSSGLFIVYSNQCTFMEKYAELISTKAVAKNIPCIMKKLASPTEAQKMGSPFGTFGIYYNGVFQTHELMPEGKIEKFLEDKCV